MFSHARAWLGVLSRQVPTVLVLAALAALGIWGARNDWQLPPWLRPKQEEPEKKEEEPDEGVSPRPVEVKDDVASLVGIALDESQNKVVAQEVEAPAVLAFYPNRYSRVAPRAAGAAWRVLKSPGDPMGKGEVMALLSSADAGKTRGAFLTAYVQHEIKAATLARVNAASTSLPARQVREARQALREARVNLLNQQNALSNLGLVLRLDELRGLSDDEVARKVRLLGLPEAVARERDLPANLLPVVSPFDGVVLQTDLVLGEMADPARPCFVVADTRLLRLFLDVRQEDVARLGLGQEVVFQARATDQVARGTLGWISPEVDPKTRTVRARADIYNPTGQFRPGTFGRARVQVQRQLAVTVPTSAIQWDGKSYRVFVRRDEKTFEPLLVLPGTRQGDRTQVHDPRPVQYAGLAGWLAGPGGPWQALAAWRGGEAILTPLPPGARVAASGSYVLKSEMQKGRIGGED
jgi:cobalt-zinc-cadmium efflux system membrane fusion protein